MNIKRIIFTTTAVALVGSMNMQLATSAQEYTVSSGDSWYAVAAQYGISASELAEANGCTIDDYLYAGDTIQIPGSSESEYYTVSSGDSWYGIAEKYDISVSSLVAANNTTIDSVVLVGEKLVIPEETASTSTTETMSTSSETSASAKSTYTVSSGESWWSIAQKFGISSISLAKANGRTVDDVVYSGEVIVVPGATSTGSHNYTSTVLSSITLYRAASGNSWYNIQLAASKLNGLIVESGQEFSWASTMGACGASQGYVEAGVYSGGTTSTGYGGGVCFVSTGLMQAARAAGCTITERHDHSLPVSYADRGDEASVSYGTWDMRFVNDTGYTLQFSLTTSSSGAMTVTCSIVD